MDTSETYIKMCDCPEIREYKGDISFKGSWYAFGEERHIYVNDNSPVMFYGIHPVIWLPTQSQLQEMVGVSPNNLCKFVLWYGGGMVICCEAEQYLAYFKWGMAKGANYTIPGGSMEQLWLSFVMKEKFNKTWDGEKWIATK